MARNHRFSRISIILFLVLAEGLNFKAAASTPTYSVLRPFQYFPRGASPYAPLFRDASGNLYGTTNGGGAENAGVVFKLSTSGSQTVMHTFTGGTDGGNPCGGLVSDSTGNLYGTAYQGGIAGTGVNQHGAGVVYKIATSGRFSVLYSFTGERDGSGPLAGVIVDAAGNLYGTTYYGGLHGYGAVYKLTPVGQETVLYSFTGGNDGSNPFAGVAIDASGNLYGTTYGGGKYAVGVVYKLSQAGQQTVLYAFGGGGVTASGTSPFVGVILDSAGNIYGAAENIVYTLSTGGNFTTLYQFFDYGFLTGLARTTSGDFYITSNATPGRGYPNGAVFKLDASGKRSLLYQFKGGEAVYGNPVPGAVSGVTASVILDAAGNLYGTTSFAGTAGIVYEIEASGTVKRLYDFLPPQGGTAPRSGLTRDSAGNLYGTTDWGGGPANAGVVYKLSPTGHETVLYTFKGGTTDGANPRYSQVVLDQAGNHLRDDSRRRPLWRGGRLQTDAVRAGNDPSQLYWRHRRRAARRGDYRFGRKFIRYYVGRRGREPDRFAGRRSI